MPEITKLSEGNRYLDCIINVDRNWGFPDMDTDDYVEYTFMIAAEEEADQELYDNMEAVCEQMGISSRYQSPDKGMSISVGSSENMHTITTNKRDDEGMISLIKDICAKLTDIGYVVGIEVNKS